MILQGDCLAVLKTLPEASVHCVITSPPYWALRNYGVPPTVWGGTPGCDHAWASAGSREGYTSKKKWQHSMTNEPKVNGRGEAAPAQKRSRLRADNPDGWNQIEQGQFCAQCGAWRGCLGLEPTPELYVEHLVTVFDEVKRVLRKDGTVWLNLGDSYAAGKPRDCEAGGMRFSNSQSFRRDRRPLGGAKHIAAPGLKPKDLVGIPWMVAFALRARGWYLRSDIIWCLSGGARVYARTKKGDAPMSVKDLVRLDPSTVQLWNGYSWTQAVGWSRSASRVGALEIELRNGERIGCTAAHVWPTQRGNVRTDALVAGDVIATTKLPEPDRPVKADALDADVAWFCGLYLAEGSMSGQTVQIAGHRSQTAARLERLEYVARKFHGTVRCHVSAGAAATVCLDGPIVAAIVRAYIAGDSAVSKGLKTRVWQRDDAFLASLLDGYLAGDGHYDAVNGRWRLGFTRNDRLAADLRTLTARLGLSMRLAPCTVNGFGRDWPAYRGDLRLEPTAHHNARLDGEVVAVRPGRGRAFWDIEVEDNPHLFALASGVLTHNSKSNPMPESTQDRPTKSHEYLFLLARSEEYFYDAEAIRENVTGTAHGRGKGVHPKAVARTGRGTGIKSNVHFSAAVRGLVASRNRRSVWTLPTAPFKGAHFATFPPRLIEPCVLAGTSAHGCCSLCGAPFRRVVKLGEPLAALKVLGGCNKDGTYHGRATKAYAAAGAQDPSAVKARILEGMRERITVGWRPTCRHTLREIEPCTVLDPFGGSGTTGLVCERLGRSYILIELGAHNVAMAEDRIAGAQPAEASA